MLWTRLNPFIPRWIAGDGLENLRPGELEGVVQDVASKQIQVVLDPASPFEFTEEGVRAALRLQKSRHAHGKVVVKIADW